MSYISISALVWFLISLRIFFYLRGRLGIVLIYIIFPLVPLAVFLAEVLLFRKLGLYNIQNFNFEFVFIAVTGLFYMVVGAIDGTVYARAYKESQKKQKNDGQHI